LQTSEFVGLEKRSSGVVGIDDDDGSGAICDGGFESREVDMPGAVVTERILADANGLERGEEFEQRIRWARREDFVAGIAEQLEQVRVGFAGAGGEQNLVGMAGDEITCPTLRVVIRNDFARGRESSGRGMVVEGAGIGKCGENFVSGVTESGMGRVGFGEVDDLRARCTLLFQQSG
jgi:hypothetical protein